MVAAAGLGGGPLVVMGVGGFVGVFVEGGTFSMVLVIGGCILIVELKKFGNKLAILVS